MCALLCASLSALLSLSSCKWSIGPEAPSTETAILEPVDAEQFRSEYLAFSNALVVCARAEGYPLYSSDTGPVVGLSDSVMIDNDELKRRIGYGVTDAKTSVQEQYLGAPDPTPSQALYTPAYRSLGVALAKCQKELEQKHPIVKRVIGDTSQGLDYASLAFEVEADVRMKVLRARWSKCMKAKGFRFNDPWDARETFAREFSELPAVKKPTTKAKTLPSEEGSFDGGGTKFTPDPRAVSRLRLEEYRAARVDADCSDPIAAERDAIWRDYIAKFGNNGVDRELNNESYEGG